jgi:hypothetical protein
MMSSGFRITIAGLALMLLFSTPASGWYDETHLAILKAAGYKKWFHAAGPDIAKIKAGRIESNNHWFNNIAGVPVTAEVVLRQVKQYNDPKNKEGHLYGAIIASLREYKKADQKGKYAEYHLVYSAHYISDLSQPLHNVPYDFFNRSHHAANDGIVNQEILKNTARMNKYVYPIYLDKNNFEQSLAVEIARIANMSRSLGITLQKEWRNMTAEEAFRQLGHSVSLFRAILEYLGEGAEQ